MSRADSDIEKINIIISRYGLNVTWHYEGGNFNQYRIKFPFDMDVNSLFALKGNFIAALCDNDVLLYQDMDEFVIKTKGSRLFIRMSDVFYKSIYTSDDRFRLVLGQDLNHKSVTTTLTKAGNLFITGSDQKEIAQVFHSLISSILLGTDNHFLIIYEKDSGYFSYYKNIDTVEYINSYYTAYDKMKWLNQTIDSRFKTMRNKGVNSFSNLDLPRIVFFINEISDIDKNYLEKTIIRANLAGCHFVLGTQNLYWKNLSDLVKEKIPAKICLKVNSEQISKAVVGTNGGVRLAGNGDMLFLGPGMSSPIRIEASCFSDTDIQNIVNISTKKSKNRGRGYKFAMPVETPLPQQYVNSNPVFQKNTESQSIQKPKRVGLFRALKNIMDAPQITFTIHEDE